MVHYDHSVFNFQLFSSSLKSMAITHCVLYLKFVLRILIAHQI